MRILCAGLATVDLVQQVERFPGPDEKVQSASVEVAAGGPAANAAVTAAALGADVTLVTAVGAHPLGDLIRADLAAHGVTLIDVAPDDLEPPPVSAVTVLAGTGERTIVSRNAGNRAVGVPQGGLPEADLTLVDGHHPALATAAARSARRLLVDAGSWRPVFAEIFPHAEVVACSADFRHPAATGPSDRATAEAVAAPHVVVTHGANPVQWFSTASAPHTLGEAGASSAGVSTADAARSGASTAEAGKSGASTAETDRPGASTAETDRPGASTADAGRSGASTADAGGSGVSASGAIDVPRVKAVDTAGAGDAFHGALAVALARGDDLPTAIAYAISVAATRVTHAGPRAWLAHLR
ncbi:PfkB family carbohydrate kinase [Actinoplanes sp. NPDC024001]|uniref:PfkB family carbohydrate kinase n=1 Tax=Actinoplanes sp. NPDC024001 TaxID=3154598 RepID=UPI0033CDEFE2